MVSIDVLKFTGVASYKKSGCLSEEYRTQRRVIPGSGASASFRIGLGVMDFAFLGGSMARLWEKS